MGKRFVNTILIIVLLVALVMLFFENTSAITGRATSANTISNVSISAYLAINMGVNLSSGIYFGNISSLPAVDLNGTHNYDGLINDTTYWIEVHSDSNTDVDFCLKANDNMSNGVGGEIPLVNETYWMTNTTTATLPDLSDAISMTTTFDKRSPPIGVGSLAYWRFWLDIPGGTETGVFNNTVSFRGVNTGTPCGS